MGESMRISESAISSSHFYKSSNVSQTKSDSSFPKVDTSSDKKLTLDDFAAKQAEEFQYANELAFLDFDSIPEGRIHDAGKLFYEMTGYHYTALPNGDFRIGDDAGNPPGMGVLDKLQKLAAVFETAKNTVDPDSDWVRIGKNDLLDALDTLKEAPDAETNYYDWLAYKLKQSSDPLDSHVAA